MIRWTSVGAGLLAVLFLGAAPPPAMRDGEPTQAAAFPGAFPGEAGRSDQSGKGAVLCSWTMAVAAQQIGSECFPGEDHEFNAELAESIGRMDRFIVENSSGRITQAFLDEKKKSLDIAGREYMDGRKAPRGRACKADSTELWRALRSGGVAQLRTGTDELLSVPREPVMDPCV